jgi:hypothetical protein
MLGQVRARLKGKGTPRDRAIAPIDIITPRLKPLYFMGCPNGGLKPRPFKTICLGKS